MQRPFPLTFVISKIIERKLAGSKIFSSDQTSGKMAYLISPLLNAWISDGICIISLNVDMIIFILFSYLFIQPPPSKHVGPVKTWTSRHVYCPGQPRLWTILKYYVLHHNSVWSMEARTTDNPYKESNLHFTLFLCIQINVHGLSVFSDCIQIMNIYVLMHLLFMH